MSIPLSAAEVMSREFLEVRCKILEIAAALDRLDRAAGDIENDPRLSRIQEGLAALGGKETDRAERVQMIFSRLYDKAWRQTLQVPS